MDLTVSQTRLLEACTGILIGARKEALSAFEHLLQAESNSCACLQRAHQALEGGGEMADERSWAGPSGEDPAYRLHLDCNQLAVDINHETAIVHIFMRDKYKCVPPPAPVCAAQRTCISAECC